MPMLTRPAARPARARLAAPLLSALAAAALLLAAGGCSKSDDAGGQAALVRRGKSVFQSTCTSCHARDPNKPGPVGPPIAGSPLELLRAKVLHGQYPSGYKPKRDTRAMPPLPYIEPDLPAIAAYLKSVKR